MAKSFLNLRETADVMNVGYGVVRRLHRIGELEAVPLGGKELVIKFRREQVERVMRKRARRQA